MPTNPKAIEEKVGPKTLSAQQVLRVMGRATPSTALKLTDPEV